MSQIFKNTIGGGGSAITTINGDTGSITGPTVTIYADNAVNNSGQSVEFVNSGTTSTLNLTDANSNTALGNNAGKLGQAYTGLTALGKNAGSHLTSGVDNTLLGTSAGELLTTGAYNVAVGYDALFESQTGSYNTAVGYAAGQSVNGSYNILLGNAAGTQLEHNESSNVLIGNIGVDNESNVIRLGTQGSGAGEQDECYIAGITGATPTSANTPQVVLCDNAGNLAPISSSTSGYVLTSTGPTTTPSFQPAGGGGSSVYFSSYLSAPTGNVTGDGTNYGPVIFNTVTSNSGSYNGSTGIFTAPATGLYSFAHTIAFVGGDISTNQYITFWNGSVFGGRAFQLNYTQLASNETTIFSATITINMTSGDTMAINALATGGSKDVEIYGSSPGSGAVPSLFSGFKVA